MSVSDRTRDLVFELEQDQWQQLFHALMVVVDYFKEHETSPGARHARAGYRALASAHAPLWLN